MTDATDLEQAAMAAALQPLGEYVGSIGMHRPLADYTRAEVLTLIEVVVSAYQEYFHKHNDDHSAGLPNGTHQRCAHRGQAMDGLDHIPF